MKKKILVTAALPYANENLHIGHLVEHCQLDIWVRAKKMSGFECYSFCADDSHGTSIMISARKKAIRPEELVGEMQENHERDLKRFDIHYDHYSTTHSETNRKLVYEIFEVLEKEGLISSKEIEQYHCPTCAMFLPDRFIKGECPKCRSKDQNGDSCDQCGSTYEPKDLIDPYCITCRSEKSSPLLKKTEHLFLSLEVFRDFLKNWVSEAVDLSVKNKLDEWLQNPLQDWGISRDEPYFGFEIPGRSDKFFYVWVDAPVGYIATTKEWAEKNGRTLEEFWCSPDIDVIHFIGKDITYFHTLFWPSMLKNTRFRLPTSIFTHGFLTVNGEKMSKSKGNFITVRDYCERLDANHFRYYLASKLDQSISDFDFNVEDFRNRINSDLIGKITNLISRAAKMLDKNFSRKLSTSLDKEGEEIIERSRGLKERIVNLYHERAFHKVILEIRMTAEEANRYFDKHKPWLLIEKDAFLAHQVLSSAAAIFRIIAVYLFPVMPSYAKKVQLLFNEKDWTFESVEMDIRGEELSSFEHLSQRVDEEGLKKVFADA